MRSAPTAVAAKDQVRTAMDPRRYLGDAWRRPISRAVVKALLTIWVTTTLTFVLIRLMPERANADGFVDYCGI